jgi:phosphoglycolate phosphatase
MRCWLLPYGYNEGRAPDSTPCDAYVQTIQEAAEKLLKIQSQS